MLHSVDYVRNLSVGFRVTATGDPEVMIELRDHMADDEVRCVPSVWRCNYISGEVVSPLAISHTEVDLLETVVAVDVGVDDKRTEAVPTSEGLIDLVLGLVIGTALTV